MASHMKSTSSTVTSSLVLPEQREAALAIRDGLMALIPEAVQRALLERTNVPS